MIKQTVTHNDLMRNEHTYATYLKIIDAFKGASLLAGERDFFVLEDVGMSLVQSSWVDRGGWYATWRVAPFYEHKIEKIAAATAFLKEAFGMIFNKTPSCVQTDGRMTLHVETSVTSVAD